MRDRERAIARLAKLLALSRSPNACEAESAARAAQELMSRWGLTTADASGASGDNYCERSLGDRGWRSAWRLSLLVACARYCGADAVIFDGQNRVSVSLAGDLLGVDRAVSLFARMVRVVKALEKDVEVIDLDGLDPGLEDDLALCGERGCSDSFRRGAVLGIIVELTRAAGEPLFRDVRARAEARKRKDDAGSGTSLVLWRPRRPDASSTEGGRPMALDDAVSWHWFRLGGDRASRVSVSGDSVTLVEPEEVARAS